MLYTRLARIAAMMGVGLIITLSLSPGSARPPTGLPGGIEHFIAYAPTAFAFGCGWPSRIQRAAIVIGLFALSGVLEALQLWVPGRHADVLTAVISGLGGLVGTLLATVATAWAANRRR